MESRVLRAAMAELVDAHGSGPCVRKGVRVRVSLAAMRATHLRVLRGDENAEAMCG